jgi:hypothetical protein
MRMISVVCGVVLTVLCGGCLQKDVVQTIYLGPGATTWTVVEGHIRSDKEKPMDRILEENDYSLAVGAGKHPVAEAFRHLGAQSVTTTWLRRERPYTVMTEARFAGLRQLATAILRDLRAQGDVSLVQNGCDTTFAVRVDVASAPPAAGDPSAGNTALDALLIDLENYRFVLAEGRFTSADGFRILDEGTVAAWDEKKTAADGILTLGLSWAEEGCVAKR